MALRELGYYSYSTERRRCVVGSNKGNLGNTQVRLSLSLFSFFFWPTTQLETNYPPI